MRMTTIASDADVLFSKESCRIGRNISFTRDDDYLMGYFSDEPLLDLTHSRQEVKAVLETDPVVLQAD
jgi:hypothetical protein